MKSEIELNFIALLKKSPKSKFEIDEVQRLGVLFSEELNLEIRDLVDELKQAGIIIESIWDLVNTKDRYPAAIDILIRHLPIRYHDKNREGIIRALTVTEAKGKANSKLIDEYNKISQEKAILRWVIGNAFYVIITSEDFENIAGIVTDKENGESRSRFISALGKIKSERSEDLLIALLDDEEVAIYALQSLSRLRSVKAEIKIGSLINSRNLNIKREALKALKKINNSLGISENISGVG